jgi:hypothetical protein
MGKPGIRIRREVGIVGEDVLPGFEFFKLDQETSIADADMQGIVNLAATEVRG